MLNDSDFRTQTISKAELILGSLIVPAAIFDSTPKIILENLMFEKMPHKKEITEETKRHLTKHLASLLLGENLSFEIETANSYVRVHATCFNVQKRYFLIQWEDLTQRQILEQKLSLVFKLSALTNSFPVTEEEKHFEPKWLKAVVNLFKIRDIALYVDSEDFYLNILKSKSLPEKLKKNVWLVKHCLMSGIEKELGKKDMEKLTSRKSKGKGLLIPIKTSKLPDILIVMESKQDFGSLTNAIPVLKPFFANIVKQKLFYATTKKVSDLFEDYPFPSVLVEKESLQIVYKNQRFKEYFGENKDFFNQILTPKSSYELLKKLEETKEVFKIYLESLDKNGFVAITKATVIPEIRSQNKKFFSVILKTQLNAVELTENVKRGTAIDLEDVSTVMHKYSLCFLKGRNTEKTVSNLLEEIRKILNTETVFIAKTLGKEKKSVIINCNPHLGLIGREIPSLISILAKARQNNYIQLHSVQSDGEHSDALNSLNAKSVLLAPIFIKRENAALGVTSKANRQWRDNEIQFLMHSANLLSMVFQKEETLKRLNEEQRKNHELEKIKRHLLTEISHEIKTPLTSIIGLSNLLETKLSDSSKEIAAHIKNNSLKLLELLETLLDMERIKQKGISVKTHPFNTAEFLEKIKSFVNGILTRESVTFYIKTENLPPYLVQDENILYRLIINLLDNAVSNTERGSITLGLKKEETTLSIEVIDTGTGMDDKDVEHFFKPYVSENFNGKNTKFGLGLYLVKEMCSALNGKITVKSVPKMGTYFKIEIPLKDEE